MKKVFTRALTLLLAVSMLFVTACGKKQAATDGGVSTTATSRESGDTTTGADDTTTTVTGAASSSTSVSVTEQPSTTVTGAVLTKPTKTGTSSVVYENPTDAFVARFDEWLVNLTEYRKVTPKVTQVSGVTVTSYALTGAKNTADYCVHVHSDANKNIGAVYVTVESKDYDFMFSVISYYVYDSLGLTGMDVDAFLEQFAAFPDSLELENKSEAGYRMACGMPDEFLTFAVLGKGTNGITTVTLQTQLQSANCSACYDDEDRALNYLTLTDKGKELGVDIAMLDRALVSSGNRARLADVMKRAKNGEDITIGFIGGSVTEGAYASDYDKTSYAGLTYAWWEKTFPKAKFTYVNAGFGGTSSLFGVHRVQADLLDHEPDFVVVEFAVNDCDHAYQTEAYASLVHRILNSASQPAVMLLCVMNSDGGNNQVNQEPIAEHYDLPMISYRDAIWPEVTAGRVSWDEIGADWVHPTDMGHAIAAELVISYLTKTYADLGSVTDAKPSYSAPYTDYVYGSALYYNRYNITPTSANGIRDGNKKNISWIGGAGSSVTFEFTGKRLILAIPTDYKDTIDVTVRIDGGEPIKVEAYLFHGGAFANCLVLDEDVSKAHTIEIVCNSGTMYLGGLFVS